MNDMDFELLVVEYEPMVRALVYHITRSPNDVDDITQEVFIKAYQSMKSFRGGSVRAYLGRIARNHCYDVLRRKKTKHHMQFVELVPDALPAESSGPLDVLVSKELIDEVSGLLDTLQPVDREIMLLRHLYQFSYEEIAGVVGMREGAVRTRLSRARQRIVELVARREKHGASFMG